MPPRFVFWTILIDGKATAFRARDREELLPTLTQLKRTNQDVVLKWFARGKLWDSPEAEHAAARRPAFTAEKRGPGWRPGGAHQDPRDRFKKKDRFEPPADRERRPFAPRPGGDRKPWSVESKGPRKPWSPKPAGFRKPWTGKPPGRQDWGTKPEAPRKSWAPKP